MHAFLQISLFRSASDGEDGAHLLEDVAHCTCAGVFDVAWRPSSDANDVGLINAVAALADGSCCLLQVTADAIALRAAADRAAGAGMALSCDWQHGCGGANVLCSSSDGSLAQCAVREASCEVVQHWQGHDLEAWMIASHPHMVRFRQQCKCGCESVPIEHAHPSLFHPHDHAPCAACARARAMRACSHT